MRAIVFAAAFFLSVPAHAAVSYEWVGLGDTPCCHGTLEISDAAFASGDASFSNATFIYPAALYVAGDIIHFQFDAAQFGPSFISGQYAIDVTLDGSGLAGSIEAFGLESSIRMQGTNDLWTISFYRTDIPGRCHFPEEDCAGQTGRWALASIPQDVDEPPTAFILMVGLGLFGLAFGAQRRANNDFNGSVS